MIKLSKKYLQSIKNLVQKRDRVFFELLRHPDLLSEEEMAFLAVKFPERWAHLRRYRKMAQYLDRISKIEGSNRSITTLRPVDAKLVEKLRRLTHGVNVDIDSPLSADDE
jgi:hypothetical protein